MRRLLFLACLLCSHVYGEVQLVELVFVPGLCNDQCARLLKERLLRINGVADASISPGTGRASVKWKPDIRFSFQDINYAARYVGIRVDEIHMRVRGNIVEEGGSIKLISVGDNTPFTLINPVMPRMGGAAVVYNAQERRLSPELAATLLDAKRDNKIATIQGLLFEPYRSPPFLLVVEQSNFENRPGR